MKTRFRLIATDMDGTLLNQRKEIPADFFPYVLSHPDIVFAIASGRQYYTLLKQFAPIRDHLLFIAENGALVMYQGKELYASPLDQDSVLKILAVLKRHPSLQAALCGKKSAYYMSDDPLAIKNLRMYYAHLEKTTAFSLPLKEDEILKLAVYGTPEDLQELVKDFPSLPKGTSGVISGANWIDISKTTNNKGKAIQAVMAKLGIPKEASLAFGDYLNDRELLLACGYPVAMANAHPDIKRISREVTLSNDEDGVMKVLRRIG